MIAIVESLATDELEAAPTVCAPLNDYWDAIYGEWFVDDYTGSDLAL